MSSGPLDRPDPAAALIRIALQLGATSVAHVNVAAVLSEVCAALPPAAGARGAVLVLDDPADPRDPDARRVFGSDPAACRVALLQQRAGAGPLPAAVRGDRTLATPDLTRTGPPELAAAAAECGLVRSLVVPVAVAGRAAGGLQLLGGAGTVLDEHLAVLLHPVVTVLGARLADVRELARLEAPAAPRPDGPAGPETDEPEPWTDASVVPRPPYPAVAVPEQNGSRPRAGEDPRTMTIRQVPSQRRDGSATSTGHRPGRPETDRETTRRPRHRRQDDDRP